MMYSISFSALMLHRQMRDRASQTRSNLRQRFTSTVDSDCGFVDSDDPEIIAENVKGVQALLAHVVPGRPTFTYAVCLFLC